MDNNKALGVKTLDRPVYVYIISLNAKCVTNFFLYNTPRLPFYSSFGALISHRLNVFLNENIEYYYNRGAL